MANNPLLYTAESWEKTYKAFEQINFTAYDYESVKQSLLDYLKVHYPENFNDYVESSQFIAQIEAFAYVAELLAYRIDMMTHENLMDSAQRKQSILRLSKLISYTTSRNLPLRGLVKINTITISENTLDSQGNSLANRQIKWNDTNNQMWREQFFRVVNKALIQPFGSPLKSFQVDDVVFQQYEVANLLESDRSKTSFVNGVLKFKTSVNGQNLDFEIVPSDIDQDGPFERDPNPNAHFNILYADDGRGDGSVLTGLMMYIKQGTMNKLPFVFSTNIPNRSIDVDLANVNDVDVWVQEVDAQGTLIKQWQPVPNVAGVNLSFNLVQNGAKYEIETREDDKIRLIFGDGDFSDIPTGIFNVWARTSTSGNMSVQQSAITDKSVTFTYISAQGNNESCTLTYSLVGDLQNSSASEDIEHIRAAAPAVYYSQNRMVNGQDYNSLFLKDPSILRLSAVNRTFAGQPKYMTWNDASGQYQNVKIFGNDGCVYYDVVGEKSISTVSSRSLVDEVIEPMLSEPGIYNLLIFASYNALAPINKAHVRPRTRFIEDSTQLINFIPVQEKTEIQGVLDRHWYGEADALVQLDANLSDTSLLPKTLHAIANNDTDHRIYDSNLKVVIKDDVNGIYTAAQIPGGISGIQDSVVREKRFGLRFNPSRPMLSSNLTLTGLAINPDKIVAETITVEIIDESGTFTVTSLATGQLPNGTVGEAFVSSKLNFIVNGTPAVGDAFIINVVATSTDSFDVTVLTANLLGRYEVIYSSDMPEDIETLVYDVTDPVASWIMLIDRVDDSDGNVAYWSITKRNFKLILESPTTSFWFDSTSTIVDSQTKLPVRDMVRILKSNLDSTRLKAIGVDQIYDVTSDVKFSNGEVNSNAISLTPSASYSIINSSTFGSSTDPIDFLRFIDAADFVYFLKNETTGGLTPVKKTSYLDSLIFVNNESGNYVRKIGRDNLDFMWQHFTPFDRMIDPSMSNIIDVYVLTRGYYSQVKDYVNGQLSSLPRPPTPMELRGTFRDVIESKMISDTVVMHSGSVKLLFGSLADPELRAKFRIVISPEAKLTGDQIRSKVLTIVNDYFRIENWDFNQSFYGTELCATIHKALPSEVASVVIVPEFPSNYFGDLYFLRCGPHEVFMSCAKLENIELVTGLDRITLKQR